jgi:hypothetical protein
MAVARVPGGSAGRVTLQVGPGVVGQHQDGPQASQQLAGETARCLLDSKLRFLLQLAGSPAPLDCGAGEVDDLLDTMQVFYDNNGASTLRLRSEELVVDFH